MAGLLLEISLSTVVESVVASWIVYRKGGLIMRRPLRIEKLEERIAPSIAPGLKGYEGQPGNQGG